MSSSGNESAPRVPTRAIVAFALGTFAITWSILWGYILFPATASRLFGEFSGSHPLYFVATWAPAIAGLGVVLAFTGRAGLRAFLSRLVMWRCAPGWWAFILLGLPLVFMAGSLAKGGPLLAPLPPEGAGPMFAVMAMMLFLGPVEELGWRGVAQPLLQRHMAPVFAGALIGAAWGVWHLPAFFLAGVVFADWNYLPFFIGNVTLAILVTPIFNSARGSLLLPMLFHWMLINPFWPDAQPFDTWILVAVTAVVCLWKRDEMFTRKSAETEVVPAAARGGLRAARA
ncbi:type II CAAX endopeptidase family protein [Roseibacterium sp. SDUM158017]|uniref:type II CAAX endopeptidase family protein n=1 Tax=Roseicyclus salinarum TaxID=3036773 RepID=UPI002414DA46|nr:type II CAAX endopeptidase family protein [Roseibacterium sp. SDUM158017]MDG4650158.1 type II CAAX endopeptidase family protein [Roseibacterium sp. SDUM158017]